MCARRWQVLGLAAALLVASTLSMHVHVHAAHAPLAGHQPLEVNTAAGDDHLDHHADYGEQDIAAPGIVKNIPFAKFLGALPATRAPLPSPRASVPTARARDTFTLLTDTDTAPPPPLRAPPRA